MSMEARIRQKLEQQFAPERLDIVNESALHSGHHGSPGTGESHFRLHIVSRAFAGKSRLERHRMINSALADELAAGVHALAITAHVPEEAQG
jgi:BolA family transcriptional regulator, general stress-responsive regulator